MEAEELEDSPSLQFLLLEEATDFAVSHILTKVKSNPKKPNI